MPKKRKILIRLDADHHVGLAHAVRVSKILSLGQSEYGAAWDFEVHVMGNMPQIDRFFKGQVHRHPLLENQQSEREKAMQLVKVARDIGADMLLIDHPHVSKISWDIYARTGLPLVAIDDEGGPVRADLIFNGTILEAYHHYPHMKAKENIRAGGKYTLINPCFRQHPWTNPRDLSLITVIGSGDRACDWALKLTGQDGPLSRLAAVKKTIVVGAAFPKMDALRKKCHDHNIGLHQGLDQDAMAALFSQNMMGLITGGMIVYEALAAGLPVIIFPQEKNLPPEADYFAKQGCAIDLGYEGGMDMDIVKAEIMTIMASPDKRLDLSRKGQKLIDGKGMFRTIEAINYFLEDIQDNRQKSTVE